VPCLLLLAACNLGPAYVRPDPGLPGAYRNTLPEQGARSIADLPWWELFDDPNLVALIKEALSDNLDLAIAAAQIVEAQAQVTAARAPVFPRVSAQGQAARGNDNASLSTANSFLAAFALSWEIDLWGRYLRATEAARANLLATEAGRTGVVASLVAGVAQQYLQIRGLRQRLDVIERTATAQRDSLRLVTLLARQGVPSAAEVRQAQSQLLATENQVPSIMRQVAQAEDALATLLGKPPRAFTVDPALPRLDLPPRVPAGVPSELLARRPDIRQAEQRLVAANANVGVARAQFFPSISLTGTLGRASTALRDLASGDGTTLHSIAGTLAQPLFSGGALVANYDAARARAEQAALGYRRTVVVALQEVSDALVAYDRDADETDNNRQRVATNSESVRLAQLRFRSGVVSYLEVLDAQRQLLSAQLDLNASELNQRLAAIQLYKALGGGWGK
jgi:multidrug efflux system outer membrane protein